MQAYGTSLGIVSPTRLKTVAAYWPVYSPDLNNQVFGNYRDDFSHSRSRGLFMRNRVLPKPKYVETPNVTKLYSGQFIQHDAYNIDRFTFIGKTLWHEFITPTKRGLNVWTFDPKRVTDITSDRNGQWAIWVCTRSAYDKRRVAPTLPSLDTLYLELLPKLGVNPTTVDRISTYGTKLESFEYPVEFQYDGIPSEPEALLRSDYFWLKTTGNLSTRDRDRAAQAAYVAAAEGIPQVTSNGVANVLEAASMLSTLLLGDFKKSSKLVGDAWLAYRYSYCTTKMDIEEYQSYVQRIIDLTDLLAPSSIRCHGTYVDAEGWKYHCVMRVKTSEALPSDLSDVIRDFGFELSAVSAWDMIPYSFIVDWFIPVSDTLSSYENHMRSQHIPIMECWMSVTSPKGDHYLRFPYKWKSVIPEMRQKTVSNKTLWMRIADSIALFL